MSAHPSENDPWPTQTPAAAAPHRTSSKRRRRRNQPPSLARSTSKFARQVITDWSAVEEAEQQCQIFSSNDVESCFPTDNTVIPQHQWAAFVWNSRRPELTQTNLVNIYLFHGDSREQILEFRNHPNARGQAGMVTAQVNDSWWTNGEAWNGSNLSYPFYWVITRNDKQLDGSEVTQAHFQAVQTTYADSVVASMASTSSAASASAASLSRASMAPSGALPTSSSGSGSVQANGAASSFPRWAIAVIVVLGFLAIATTCILAFFIIRRIRRRNGHSNRNSMGSNSPMMAHTGNSPGSPLLVQGHGPERHSSVGHHAPSLVSPDGASTISRAGSAGDTGPFSGADAAIMADAFRQALRKPDFAGRPVEEGESPENQAAKEELLNRELAEEGRDIRSVSSSRGVKVETLSDSGDTVHDSRH